ncbi:MAG: hypothetical protein IKX95_03750 [Lachnospiraceae bacterium]|nr:hypothetical protein [Lachnospiraceae bacterium]
MKERVLRSAFIIVLAAGLMLTAACGKQEGSQGSMSDTLKKKAEDAQTASSDVKDNDEASPAEPEETKEADEQPAEPEEVKQEILTEAECRAKIELLRGTQPVHPTEARTLSDMAKLVAFSKVLNEQGAIFSKMDNYTRAILRSQIIDEIMWGESVFYEAIPVESSEGRYEADSLIKVDDAEGLFKDIYGEEDFTPAEYEHVEDGYILLSFGDGEPWHTIEHMQFFEDENYFLTSGPAFYEDNGGCVSFVGYEDILFMKNPDSRYGVTLLYGRYRDDKIKVSYVETSSELPEAKGKTYSGMNLVDGDYSTVWAEGVSGTGTGETITLHLDSEQPVYGVQICNGYTADYDLFTKNGKLTDVKVEFGSEKAMAGSLEEGYAYEGYSPEDLAYTNLSRIELDEPVVTDTITIIITGAAAGEKYDDTCVSEIRVY